MSIFRFTPLMLLATALAFAAEREQPRTPANRDPGAGTGAVKRAGRMPADSAAADTSSGVVQIVEYIAHPTLQLITWPLQNVLAPGIEALTYPVQPPVRYFLEEDVIDRSTDLFQFGADRNLSVYPTVSLASGTSSRTGVTTRHDAPFGREADKSVSYFHYYVNGDYRIRTLFERDNLFGRRWRGKLAFGLNRFEGATFYQPDVNTLYFYSNHSESYEAQMDAPLHDAFYLRTGFTLRNNRMGEAPPAMSALPGNRLSSDFFRDENGVLDTTGAYRGLNVDFLDRVWLLGVVRDSRTNANIPLDGSRLEAGLYFHDAGRAHDFVEWRAHFTTYYKLGAERYEITAREERRRGGLSVDRFVRQLEYQRLRQSMFSRKVLVLHVTGGRSYELPGNSMPLYGLQALGNGTPLRAYPGSRYRNYAVAAASMEYRFPLLRIMDGMFFNEYGVYGRAMDRFDFADDLRNSWGFGVRVRQPDMFLFRVEVAFSGFSGAVLNVNADTPF